MAEGQNWVEFFLVQVLFLGVRNASKGGLSSSQAVSDSGALYDQPECNGIRAVIFLKWVWEKKKKKFLFRLDSCDYEH